MCYWCAILLGKTRKLHKNKIANEGKEKFWIIWEFESYLISPFIIQGIRYLLSLNKTFIFDPRKDNQFKNISITTFSPYRPLVLVSLSLLFNRLLRRCVTFECICHKTLDIIQYYSPRFFHREFPQAL